MAVLRYKEIFIGIENWVYELLEIDDHPNLIHYTPSGKTIRCLPKIISKNKAKEIIKKEGLVVAYKDDSGETIWDTPDKAYQERWKGTKIDDEL